MDDLGVELHSVEAVRLVRYERVGGILGRSDSLEALGEPLYFVAVRIPDLNGGFDTFQKLSAAVERERAEAVFPLPAGYDFAAEHFSHELQSIAYSEHGNAELENFRVGARGALRKDARGAARENDAADAAFFEVGRLGVERHYFGIYAALADAAGDDLRVLRAEV